MKAFFRFFAKRHLLANVMTFMVILIGLNTLSSIKRDSYPEVDYGFVNISTVYPGASPEDVEINVTNKIEKELKSVSGIKETVSISMENVSLIKVTIEPDIKDNKKAKMDIRDAVNRVIDFPPEVKDLPLIEEINTGYIPVMEVGISGDVPYKDIRKYSRMIEKKIRALPGVARFDKFGYRAREIQIELSPDKINEYQIPIREVINAIQKRNIRSTAGTMESFTTEKNIVTLAQFKSPLDVGDVIIRSSYDSPLIKVKDVAVVVDGFEEESVLSRIGGKRAISYMIYKTEAADIIRTSNAVRKLVEEESQYLPEEINLSVATDYSHYVKNRFRVVLTNASLGLLFVIIVLTLFLNLRASLWVAVGIPVSLLGAIFFMPFFDTFLDSLTLSAMIMVIGIIVDDGIIISENILKHRERGKDPLQASVDGITEVFWPVLTTIFTTFVAFAPMFFMSGLFGKFVFVMPLVISLALFVSLFEVSLALPAHMVSSMKHRNLVKSQGLWMKSFNDAYRKLMPRILKQRVWIVIGFIVLLMASMMYAKFNMKFVLFPSTMAEEFYIFAELPKGSNLQTTSKNFVDLENIVNDLPKNELVSSVARIGSNPFFGAASENQGYMIVSLTPYTKRSRTADQIVDELRGKTDQLPGFKKIIFSVETGGPSVGKPFSLHIVGSDNALREALAGEVEKFLAATEGVSDINRSDKFGKDQMELQLDYDRIARLGLTTADIAQTLRIAYDGEIVTSVRYEDEDVDFRVIYDHESREDYDNIDQLLVPNETNKLIPLNRFATFKSGPGLSNYRHYEGERVITISADVDKKIIMPATVMNMVYQKFNLNHGWPGMQFVKGGEAFETEKSVSSLKRTFIIALLGIYFILIILFHSLLQPFLVLCAIPFGLIGVIIAFGLHQEPLSFLAMMGVIGLSGVVVNDSLVLVNHINQLRIEKPNASIIEVVSEGTADRLRAIVMTTLTTVVGLLPLAYGLGGTDPFVAPMALALSYGLIFATPLTLVLVPSLYVIGFNMCHKFKDSQTVRRELQTVRSDL